MPAHFLFRYQCRRVQGLRHHLTAKPNSIPNLTRNIHVSVRDLDQPGCRTMIYTIGISAGTLSSYLILTYSGVSFARDKDSRVIIPSSFNRAQDFMLLLAMTYSLMTAVLPTHLLTSAGLHFGHALTWTIFHTLCLGLILHAQSTRKFLVRHFLKHYHYPAGDVSRGAIREAFSSWKAVYNLSMCMSYGPCALFVTALTMS